MPKKMKKFQVETDELMDLQANLIDDWKSEEVQEKPESLTN